MAISNPKIWTQWLEIQQWDLRIYNCTHIFISSPHLRNVLGRTKHQDCLIHKFPSSFTLLPFFLQCVFPPRKYDLFPDVTSCMYVGRFHQVFVFSNGKRTHVSYQLWFISVWASSRIYHDEKAKCLRTWASCRLLFVMFHYDSLHGFPSSFYDFILFCLKLDLMLTLSLIVDSLFDQVDSIAISRKPLSKYQFGFILNV